MQDALTKLFRNRGGAVIAGAIAAGVAIILLAVYLQSYRSSVDSGTRPERVLVAKKLIAKGTSGSLVAGQNLYAVTTVPRDQLKLDAITDPSGLVNQIAAADIWPGQQLTASDFTAEAPASITYEITGRQRAIAIPVDSAHGLIGQVSAGDYVDVYVGVTGAAGGGEGDGDVNQPSTSGGTIVTLLQPDVYVLAAPGAGSANAVLRVSTQDAAKFAFAADNTRIWLVLRPQVGASATPAETATLASLTAGLK